VLKQPEEKELERASKKDGSKKKSKFGRGSVVYFCNLFISFLSVLFTPTFIFCL
jgi:hypothetical protein